MTDWNQTWTTLGTPLGVIEGAKALAAEEWLDPVANSWNRPYVASVARSEYADRPLGDVYELTLDVGPELILERIERIQLLVGLSYWVKQQ